mmetsp:Transcript_23214/g.72531  ORF Transcript_23214/g.72531 Transcript_23214/m.72531 type:complete len:213 (-) Transcript_23214:2010-2648(-)
MPRGQRGGAGGGLLRRGGRGARAPRRRRAHRREHADELRLVALPHPLHALHHRHACGRGPEAGGLPHPGGPRGLGAHQEDAGDGDHVGRGHVHQQVPYLPRADGQRSLKEGEPRALPPDQAHVRAQGRARRQLQDRDGRHGLGRGRAHRGDGVHPAVRRPRADAHHDSGAQREQRPGATGAQVRAADPRAQAGAGHARHVRGARAGDVRGLH